MRLHIVSDLHHDQPGNAMSLLERPQVEADVIVVPGDFMSPGSHGLRFLRRLYMDTTVPLVVVPGNHCFYSEGDPKKLRLDSTLKTTFADERKRMRDEADKLGIILLDDDAVDIDGVRFVGGTLWTDLSARPPYMSFTEAAREAEKRFSDFRNIKVGAGRSKDTFDVRTMVAAHQATRMFLGHTLATPFDGDTIVVTHHAPSYRSLLGWDPAMPRAFGYLDWLFASDLEHLMQGPDAPLMWIHGHIHQNRDYVVGGTRVLCNPRGYAPERGHRLRENPHFNPGLIIEIEPRPSLSMRGL